MMRKSSSLMTLICVTCILCLTGCEASTPTPLPLEELIAILEASDPALVDYDDLEPSEGFADFIFAVNELRELGPAAAAAAPALARALQFPRRDADVACPALVAIGPSAEIAIPELTDALKSDYANARRDAAYVLGIIGERSKCAVPDIAPLLWDSDPFVRSAAAGALDKITGIDLVAKIYDLDPASDPCSVFGDSDGGEISGEACSWWTEEGQYLDWTEGAALCDPDGS